jgi:hypothetical protein
MNGKLGIRVIEHIKGLHVKLINFGRVEMGRSNEWDLPIHGK